MEEDQGGQLEPTPPPAQTEAPPQAPPVQNAEPEPEPEGTVVNPGGEKLVPLTAVVDLRGKVRAEKEAREKLEAEVTELRAKKTQFEAAAADFRRIEPLIQKLQQQPPPPAPAGPLSPQDAIDYAKDLDLYKADGTPDVDRAQRLALRQQHLAQQTAQQVVQPLYQTSAQQQSQANFNHALNFKDKNGVQIDKPTLERVWGMMPPEMSARPDIAGVLYKVAIAEMVQAGLYKGSVAPPPPPQFTESLGGNGAAPRELTQLDRNMITAGQIKAKDYESISSNFKPGQTNSLE